MSKQRHEIGYTGAKVARSTGTSRPTGKRAVKRAKRQTGSVTRRRVERRAKEIARPGSDGTSARSNRRTATRKAAGGSTRARSTGGARGKRSTPARSSGRLTHTTTDHEEIRRWAEERGGRPAAVKRTGRDSDVGIIRIDFPGYSGGKSLKEISWGEFFEKFEESNLALIHQKHTSGGKRSNFNKLVKRE